MVSLSLSGCISQTQTSKGTLEETTISARFYDATGNLIFALNIPANVGDNALEILKREVLVTVKNSSYGPYVTKIGNLEPKEGEYLALYINGEYASVGINDVKIEKNMLIEWKIESVGNYAQ